MALTNEVSIKPINQNFQSTICENNGYVVDLLNPALSKATKFLTQKVIWSKSFSYFHRTFRFKKLWCYVTTSKKYLEQVCKEWDEAAQIKHK